MISKRWGTGLCDTFKPQLDICDYRPHLLIEFDQNWYCSCITMLLTKNKSKLPPAVIRRFCIFTGFKPVGIDLQKRIIPNFARKNYRHFGKSIPNGLKSVKTQNCRLAAGMVAASDRSADCGFDQSFI